MKPIYFVLNLLFKIDESENDLSERSASVSLNAAFGHIPAP